MMNNKFFKIKEMFNWFNEYLNNDKNKFIKKRKNIINWLDKCHIKNYKLIPDEQYGFVINVDGDVDLSRKNLTIIPVKFNIVKGGFNCSYNQLTTLEFSPESVGGSFDCCSNELKSLKFCPQSVGKSFFCDDNQLGSLKFCPKTINGQFYCDNNELMSLEFCPQSVKGVFVCSNNKFLYSLSKSYNNEEYNDLLIYLEYTKLKKESTSLRISRPKNKIKKEENIEISKDLDDFNALMIGVIKAQRDKNSIKTLEHALEKEQLKKINGTSFDTSNIKMLREKVSNNHSNYKPK